MSWQSKVAWSEGLFLRTQHLQQVDRYHETLLDQRTRHITPYPWGFSALEFDTDMAQQSRFGLRRAAGVMPDGLPFDMPTHSPLPAPIDVPDGAAGQTVWLMLPVAVANTREVDRSERSPARFLTGVEKVVDSTSDLRVEEDIEVAHPRLQFEIRSTPKPGFVGLAMGRIVEIRDKTVLFDQKFAPALLVCDAHPVVRGWIDRVVGWIDNRREELARYAADPTAGGGLRSSDYFMLQLLNRSVPHLRHLQRSQYAHPERLFVQLLELAGELATFTTAERSAREYPAYDQDNLEKTFTPVLDDIQRFLSTHLDRRAIRLSLVERGPNAYVSAVQDRNLFRTAAFVLEVAASKPLSEIQIQLPSLLKVGPNTRMNEIVHANLPGIALIHLPMPPPQIRALTNHVYFQFDRQSPMWPEFSQASAIGLHFSGDWPNLEMELWAIREGQA